MTTFRTPSPIILTLDVAVGDIRLTAGDVTETVVDVRPTDPGRTEDVRAAERTTVVQTDGEISVRGPKQKTLGLVGKVGSIDLSITLPTGSHLTGTTAMAEFRVDGRLGDCRVKTATGNLQFQQVRAFDGTTSAGDITVEAIAGTAELSSSTGQIRVGHLGGTATVKASNGRVLIGEVVGDLVVKSANGDVAVDIARANVSASTANGDVLVNDLVRGRASLKTGCGKIAVGIHSGTAAKLDLGSSFGRVNNSIPVADGPGTATDTLDLYAHTGLGDIDIRRA